MKIVIDNKIPFIREVFEPHAEVLYLPGGEIRREHLLDADCLLVRTRTRCDQKLLEGTSIKFIGTATIGFDHIDITWCEENGICWTNAPGCNSGSVAQYVTAALSEMAKRKGFDLKDKTLGIIGVGHVGKKVEKIARELGMQLILNDPPRERTEGSSAFTNLPELLISSDIITILVPLNREGPDRTINLVDRQFLDALKPGTILINTSRGEVLNEGEVVRELRELRELRGLRELRELRGLRELRELRELRGLGGMVIDVWQNEPDINRELLGLADIATPHIAGYSVNGKYNATTRMVEAVSDFFQLSIPPIPPLTKDGVAVKQNGPMAYYDIMADDFRLRESPETFEQQRNNYPERWEFRSDGK